MEQIEQQEEKSDVPVLPLPGKRLSGQYKESFAFATISRRLPVILTQVIDTIYKYRNEALELHGQEGANDCKEIVGKLSALKNKMQTDKALDEVDDDRPDVGLWNQYLKEETERCGGIPPSWFKSAWLYVECYMYRAINEAIAQSSCLKTFDPFQGQKQSSLTSSHEAMVTLASYLEEVASGGTASYEKFSEFIQISLWGNRCDLSISSGVENFQKISPLAQLVNLQPKILANDMHSIWQTLCAAAETRQAKPDKTGQNRIRLDMVIDNAGFELFTDLVLVDYLLRVKLIDTAHFHMKAMPWFVSDVMGHDWEWTLRALREDEATAVSSLGQRFQERVGSGVCVVHDHHFWTTFHEYSGMREVCPDLYRELGRSDLAIFKGDLNYRKLVADRSWPPTTPFEMALQGFHPTPLCVLRTLKADVVVGLREGMAEEKQAENKDWMVTGENAVIQFCGKVVNSL